MDMLYKLQESIIDKLGIDVMARNGLLTFGKKFCEMHRIILDTGANSGNYVGEKILIRMGIDEKTCRKCDHEVRLGDGSTKMTVDRIISLGVVFFKTEQEIAARHDSLDFYVVPTMGDEAIIGCRALLGPLFDFFIDLLHDAHNMLQSNSLHRFDNMEWSSDYVEPAPYAIVNPWEKTLESCPEDDSIPLPTNYSDDVLNFMEVSVDESRREYLDMVDNDPHISDECRQSCPAIVDLLRSPKAIDVFAPAEWRGLKIAPTDLETKDSLPDRLSYKVRPVRPQLLAQAKEEFDRLSKYMFVPSTSVYAAPLTIAAKPSTTPGGPPGMRFCGDFRGINQHIKKQRY